MRGARFGAVAMTAAVLLAAGCGGGSGSGSDLSFCELVDSFNAAPDPFEDVDLTDTAAAEKAFNEYVDRMDSLVDAAPPELADDVTMVAEFFQELVDVIAAADFDILAVGDQLSDLEARSADLTEPTQRVREYAETECGTDLGNLPGDTGTADTTEAPAG